MSIPSLINPSTYQTVQDSLWHIASSTNSGQTDFKYVFDVFKGAEQLVRVKIFPDVNNGKGYFDAGAIVRNEITYDWFVPQSAAYVYLNEITVVDGLVGLSYDIRVGEDFSGTTTLNLASGSTIAYNYAAPLFNRKQISIASKDRNWLSNRDKNITASLNDKILIPFFEPDGKLYLLVKLYGYNNNLIDTFNEYQEGGDGGSADMLQCDIGTVALNNLMSAADIEINSNVKYYTVQAVNESAVAYGNIIKVTLDCNPKYTTTNLYFINQWGMFDTARFSLVRKLTMDIERKGFERKEYTLNSTSVDYYNANNVYNESKVNYGSKSNWSYKLTMDFPSDIDYQWLAELIQSPQIYAEIDGDYYPVSIKATNYEYSEYVFNKLKVFEIDIELNQKRYGFIR
jgi:hypothetical protein